MLAIEGAVAFDAEALRVLADRRWFATAPPEGRYAPSLVLRRWPGDTVVAFYALVGRDGAAETPPRFAVDAEDWEPVEIEAPARRWRGTLRTPDDDRYPVEWTEAPVGETIVRLGALAIVGDAGLPEPLAHGPAIEARALFRRVRLTSDPDRLGRVATRVDRPLEVPQLYPPAGRGDERTMAWTGIRGSVFTLGVPPGLVAVRTDLGFTPPTGAPGATLWLRGRWIDRDGTAVTVGDAFRTGHAAIHEGPPDGWLERAPEGLGRATRLADEPFELASRMSEAHSARAQRWREPGFAGEWLVFRLKFDGFGGEIALPVAEGRRSPSLFWIPATWRAPDRPPAPPPIDPAARFGIDFARWTDRDRADNPWSEGFLTAPRFRLELPRDWWPIASMRSPTGFPVRLRDPDGAIVAAIELLAPGDGAIEAARRTEGVVALDKPGRHRAREVLQAPDGTTWFIAKDGGGVRFRRLAPEDAPDGNATAERSAPVGRGDASGRAEDWNRLLRTVILLRSGSKRS